MNKQAMIDRGYVPATCTLNEELAPLLILSEISVGRDPCAGCNLDRKICKGRPNTVEPNYSFRQTTERMALEKEVIDAVGYDNSIQGWKEPIK